MFSRLLGFQPYAALAVILAFIGLTWSWDGRGREIRQLNLDLDNLRLELNSRIAEVERLKKGASALSLAAQSQGRIYQTDLDRRERISEVMSVCAPEPADTIKGVINDETSNRAVDLLNSDFFGPLGGGLHGAAEAGTGRAYMVSAAASP